MKYQWQWFSFIKHQILLIESLKQIMILNEYNYLLLKSRLKNGSLWLTVGVCNRLISERNFLGEMGGNISSAGSDCSLLNFEALLAPLSGGCKELILINVTCFVEEVEALNCSTYSKLNWVMRI